MFIASSCNLGNDCYVNQLSWSNTDPIAVIGTTTIDDNEGDTYQVQFVNGEGQLIQNSNITHDSEATVFDWQPNGRILAIGWADGLVSCWMVDGRIRASSTFSNSSQHNAAITVIQWSPNGKRLITGDKKGHIWVWSADARGTLSPTRQYSKKGEITCAVFCVMPSRNENKKKNEKSIITSSSFFFATSSGSVVYADDLGHMTDVVQIPSVIDSLLFYSEKARLVIITRSLLFTQYQLGEDGRLSKYMQVKLSIAGDVSEKGLKNVVWASPGLLAAASYERLVRLLDIGADENYNLSLSALGDVVERSDKVTAVAFGPLDRYLAVGTERGVFAVWRFNGPIRDVRGKATSVTATSSSDWELYYKTSLNSPIIQLSWYGGKGTVAAVTDDGVVVYTETVMQSGMCGDLAVVQTASHDIAINIIGYQEQWKENTGMLVKGLHVGGGCFVVWGGKAARVYRVDSALNNIEPLEPFSSSGRAMAIASASEKGVSDDTLFIAESGIIKACNFSGVQKGTITFSESEGQPEFIDINTRYLAVITTKKYIKIYDVSKPKDPKQLSIGRFTDFGVGDDESNIRVRSFKVNCDGSRVAILADHVEGNLQVRHPDSRLHVYDRNRGSINTHDFSTVKRRPVSIFWDEEDDRMLACEAQRDRIKAVPVDSKSSESSDLKKSTDTGDIDPNEIEVFLFFATTENGLLMQDSFTRKQPFGPMIAFIVPRIYFRDAQNMDHEDNRINNGVKIYPKVMRDFIGIHDVDDKMKVALLDFSYNLTLGKLDEAYKAVKTIGSSTIWENMAQMCVKTKRLDVAEICLGNMGNARGAAAVRESKKYNSLEASVGVLAIQIGLLDDAARLFREAERYDLLNKLYQSAGIWDKAITIATSKDRIHLKNSYYQLAKHLESIGDISGAISNYEKADVSRTEIPRMLFSLGRLDDLEDYIHKSDDIQLLKWWAAYMESNERYDKARKYYAKSQDYLSLVRIACFKGNLPDAAAIVQESGDKAAAYHFARQLEQEGEYQEAMEFYAQAGCYNHSIRLARAFKLDADLVKYAINSTPTLMLKCAQHFEAKGELEKAIDLYHKGGDLPKALDLCFQAGEEKQSKSSAIFDMLNHIAQDLGANTSPMVLARCAEFLLQHKQFEKAIELYVMAKRYLQVINLCIEHRVPLNEEMVEKLSPPEDMNAEERKEILKELAKALKRQGSYTLASKKYTQAGDRVRAIKCLVRSGDTKAVIQFASISRTAEIYKLAANYLQQMNWRESVDIMKAIITFYTKAKSFEQLAGFYDSCAQVEIDEYRDYEKAIGALREALKYLAKAPPSRQSSDMTTSIDMRILLIEKFVQARRAAQREPDTMVAICEALLQEPMLEEAIRAGDCLAMLIDYFHSKGRMREAYAYIQEMEERRIPINPYVDAVILEEIYKACGMNIGRPSASNTSKPSTYDSRGGNGPMSPGDDEVVDEDIDEEIEEEDYHVSPKKGAQFNRRPQSAAFRK